MFFLVMLISCERKEGNTDEKENNINVQHELREDCLLAESDLLNENITAQDYNTAGMYYLNMGMWHEAALMFSQAISLEWDNALANYNLARAYSMYISDAIESWDPSDTSGFWFFNNILSEDVMGAVALGRLRFSIQLDASLKNKARQDLYLEFLRTSQIELFDAITLHKDQRRRFTYSLVFTGFNMLPNSPFSEVSLSFYLFDMQLRRHIFFLYFEDEIFIYGNTEMFGKKFEIEYIYEPARSGFLSAFHTIRVPKAISVIEL